MTRTNLVLLIVFLGLLALVLFFDGAGGVRGGDPSISLELFPEFNPLDAERIEIRGPQGAVDLRRSGDGWVVASSADYPANEEQIDALLAKLAEVKKGNIASRNPESHAPLGVDGSGVITIVRGENDSVLVQLYVGARGPRGQSVFVRKEGMDEVFSVLDPDVARLCTPVRFVWFRDRDVLAFDHRLAQRIEIRQGSDLVVLERGDTGDWVETAPVEIGVDQKVVNNLARALGTLQFTDVVQGTPDKLGFEPPAGEVRVVLDDGQSQAVTFGGKTGDGTLRFVKREGSPFTFLVSSKLDAQVFATGYSFIEDKTGTGEAEERRTFEGPPIGPDLVRTAIRADVVVLARAAPTAVHEDGSLAVEPAAGEEWVAVPFDVGEVLYGERDLPADSGEATGSGGAESESKRAVTVLLPARRKLPNLSPQGAYYLLFLQKSDAGLRLQGDPTETLFQPDVDKLKYVRQILGQKAQSDAAREAQEKASAGDDGKKDGGE